MEKDRTKLVEDGNTIYEIDLDCVRRKKMEQERQKNLKQQREKQGRYYREK